MSAPGGVMLLRRQHRISRSPYGTSPRWTHVFLQAQSVRMGEGVSPHGRSQYGIRIQSGCSVSLQVDLDRLIEDIYLSPQLSKQDRERIEIACSNASAKTDKFLVGVSLPDCAAPCAFGAERCRSARGEPAVISGRGRGGRCPGYPSEGRRDPSDRWFRRRTGKRSSAAWP